MILYRVVQEDWKERKGINDDFDGWNTFDYSDNQKYIHFFLLPECAKIYQQLKYQNQNKKSLILKCNVPFCLIKDNFGCGMYRWFDPHIRTPFLEARIKYEDFDENMILEIKESLPDDWENKEIYERFLAVTVYHCGCSPVEIKLDEHNNKKISLNSKFNFLHFFPKEQLIAENITCEDYPVANNSNSSLSKDTNNLKSKKLLLTEIKKFLTNNFTSNKRQHK